MSEESFKISVSLKHEYLDSCDAPLKVSEIRCVFPKTWLLDWASREDGGGENIAETIDLLPLLKKDTGSPELNTDLLFPTDVFAMPISDADIVFARYSHSPASFKKDSEPFHPNAGMIYRIPEKEEPLSSFMDFNIFTGSVKYEKEAQSILLVEELTIGDVVKLTLSTLLLDSYYSVFLEYGDILIELLPHDQRRLKELHSWNDGDAHMRVRKTLRGKKDVIYPIVCPSFLDSETDKLPEDSYGTRGDQSVTRDDENLKGDADEKMSIDSENDNCLDNLTGQSSHFSVGQEQTLETQSDNATTSTVHSIDNIGYDHRRSISPTQSLYPHANQEITLAVHLDDDVTIFVHPMDSIAGVCRKMLELSQPQEDCYPVFYQRKGASGSELIHSHLAKPLQHLSELEDLRLFIIWEPIMDTEKELNDFWKKTREKFINLLWSMRDQPTNDVLVYRVGLNNYNSHCYLNSVVQCLTHLKPIRNYFVDSDYLMKRLEATESLLHDFDANGQLVNFNWKNRNLCDLVYWFLHILQFFHVGESASYDPKELLKYFCELHEDFEVGATNDALMCLCGLLESLHNFLCQFIESTPSSSTLLTATSKSSSLITSAFTGKLLILTQCKSCFHEIDSEGDFRFLSLNLNVKRTTATFVVYLIPDGEWFDVNRPTQVTLPLENLNIPIEDVARMAIPNFSPVQWQPFLVINEFTNASRVSWQLLANRISSVQSLFIYRNVHFEDCFADFYSASHLNVRIPPLPLTGITSCMYSDEAFAAAFHSPAIQNLLTFFRERGFWVEIKPRLWRGKRVEFWVDVNPEFPSIWRFIDKTQRNEEDGVSLNDLLEHHCAPTTLCEESDFRCKSCGSMNPRNCVMQTKFSTPPEVLILHLRRFEMSRSTQQHKNGIHVFCPNQLDISRFVIGGNCFTQYQLVAAVSHSGEDIHTGHYRAFCKSRIHNTEDWNISDHQNWISFDDTVVTNYSALPTNETVLLFYEGIPFNNVQ